LGVWDKTSTSKNENMIHVCLENKITTFDHADIYGSYTTEADFGKAFASSKIAKKCNYLKWDSNAVRK
jgi:predicted oxidoreductase